MFSVEGDDREGEFLKNGSGRGRRGNNSNRGFNNGGREVFDWDVREWDMINDFLEL